MDPLYDAPDLNRFIRTVIPFLRESTAGAADPVP